MKVLASASPSDHRDWGTISPSPWHVPQSRRSIPRTAFSRDTSHADSGSASSAGVSAIASSARTGGNSIKNTASPPGKIAD